MKKRNLTGMLAGVCISAALLAGVSGMGIQAEAAENTAAYSSIIASGNCGKAGQNVTWKLDADGVLTISGKGDILGESYQSYMPWADYAYQVKKVVMEEGITSIGYCAFANCSQITEIKIPDTVKSIDGKVFYRCSSLESVDLGKGVTFIDENAFCYTAIKSITLPKQLTELNTYSLNEAKELEAIYVEAGNSVFSSKDGVLYTNGGKTLFRCPINKAGSFTIPSGVTELASDAFYRCVVTEINMPSSLKKIGSDAFRECDNVTKLEFPDNVEEIPTYLCLACENLSEVKLPKNLKTLGYGAFSSCDNLSTVVIPSGVTSIGADAFPETTQVDWKNEKNLTQLEDGSYAQMAKVSVTVSEEYKKAFEVLELVNKERKKAGADPLVMDQGLLETAMKRGAETVIYWSHTRPSGQSCFSADSSMAGENIALGNSTAESVMESWMNSPGHKANILGSGYKSIGIGCVKCNGGYFWVQCFGRETGTSVSAKSYKDATKTAKVLVSQEKEYFTPLIGVSQKYLKKGDSLPVVFKWRNGYYTMTLDASTLKAQTSDSSVVKVSNGKIVAVGAGTAKVSLYVEGCPDQKKVLEFEVEDNGSSTGNTAKKVKVSWNANGGKVSGSSKVVKYKGTYGKLPSPKRAGYTFAGWYTSRTGGSKVAANTKVTKKKNHTLYARWKKTAVGNAAIGKLTNVSGKKLKVQIKSIKGAKKYQVYLAEDAKFSKGKKIVTFGKSTGTITKLKKGTTYYVKVRGYCNDSAGKRVYGKFSAVKKIEIKK